MKKIITLLLITALSCQIVAQNKMTVLKSFESVNTSIKTMEELESAYNIIANSPIFLNTKKEKLNNCENRSEYSFLILKKLGFKPTNFWLLKEGLVEASYDTPKKVKRSNGLCYIPISSSSVLGCWGYHVATGVEIEIDGIKRIMIIDPWTQGKLTTLEDWSLSFFQEKNGRTAYIFPVNENFRFYGTDNKSQVSYLKTDWDKNLDDDNNQMYCGLCGITPNEKCEKKRFEIEIINKRKEITAYLKSHNIEL